MSKYGIARVWVLVGLLLVVGCGDDESAPATSDDTTSVDSTSVDAEADLESAEDTGRTSDAIADTGPGDGSLSDLSDDVSDLGAPDQGADAASDSVASDGDISDIGVVDPPRISVTIAGIRDSMNGSRPYTDPETEALVDFHLRVNRHNVDLEVRSAIDSGPLDWATLELRCNVPIDFEAGTLAREEPFPAEVFVPIGDGAGQRVTFTEDQPLPDAEALTCTARVTGLGGVGESELTFESRALPPELDPFPSEDLWLLDFSTDFYEDTRTPQDDGTILVNFTRVPGGNGESDFVEAMAHLGLMTLENTAADQAMLAHLKEQITIETQSCFVQDDGRSVRLRVLQAEDPEAPDVASYSASSSSDEDRFSVIGVGGWSFERTSSCAVVGTSTSDRNNRFTTFLSVPERGVFANCLISSLLSSPVSITTVDLLQPELGAPFGTVEGDIDWLSDAFDPTGLTAEERARHSQWQLLSDAGVIFLTNVVCHEIAHDLGLTQNGPPPFGLFGGTSAPEFSGEYTTGNHIDTGNNIMASYRELTQALAWLTSRPEFNELNWAYLTRQLVHGATTHEIPVAVNELPAGDRVPEASVCIIPDEDEQYCETTSEEGVTTLVAPRTEFWVATVDGDTIASMALDLRAQHGAVFLPVIPQMWVENWLTESETTWQEGKGALFITLRHCTVEGCTFGVSDVSIESSGLADADVFVDVEGSLVALDALTGDEVWTSVVAFNIEPGVLELALTWLGDPCLERYFDASPGLGFIGSSILSDRVTIQLVDCL